MAIKASVISIAVSKPKIVEWRGTQVSTGIFKEPVTGKVRLGRLNLDGDQQADLTVHGGPDKAVYGYPSEHYKYWSQELPDRDLPWGMFGENLTTVGLNEDNVCIGDKFRIGTAVFMVAQPRLPCYKLGIKFGDRGIIKRFFKSGRWGFYFSVVEEGELETGDDIIYLGGDGLKVKLSDVTRLFLDPDVDHKEFSRILQSNLAEQMKSAVAQSRNGEN